MIGFLILLGIAIVCVVGSIIAVVWIIFPFIVINQLNKILLILEEGEDNA